MKLKTLCLTFMLASSFVQADELKNSQLSTLAAGIRASTDPAVIAAVAIRDDTIITNWCNQLTTTNAWNEAVSSDDLVAAMDFTKYDTVSQGKRDAWELFLQYTPYDFGTAKNRRVIEDVWGTVDGVAVLTAALRKANNCELILGGVSETRNTVTGLDLNVERVFQPEDISQALNKF